VIHDPVKLFDGSWVLSERELTHRGQRCRVGHLQLTILQRLVADAGKVVSRHELSRDAWGADHVDPRTIEQAMKRLRQSLPPHAIQTIRNGGYRFDGNVKLMTDSVDASARATAVGTTHTPQEEQVQVYPGFIQRQRAIIDEDSFVSRLRLGIVSTGEYHRSNAVGPVAIGGVPSMPGINDMEAIRFRAQICRFIEAAGWPLDKLIRGLEPPTDDLFGITLRYYARRAEPIPLHLRALRYALAKDGIQSRVEFIRSKTARKEIVLIVGANPRFP
jgi:DNA-binding winged helix-turn-helix (wHTH) protein